MIAFKLNFCQFIDKKYLKNFIFSKLMLSILFFIYIHFSNIIHHQQNGWFVIRPIIGQTCEFHVHNSMLSSVYENIIFIIYPNGSILPIHYMGKKFSPCHTKKTLIRLLYVFPKVSLSLRSEKNMFVIHLKNIFLFLRT